MLWGWQFSTAIAPTFAYGRDTCIEGESGLYSVLDEKLIANYNRS